MMKAARKHVAFGAPNFLSLCKDSFVFSLKRQRSVIFALYPDNAFDAGRSAICLFTAKSANCQLFYLLYNGFAKAKFMPLCGSQFPTNLLKV